MFKTEMSVLAPLLGGLLMLSISVYFAIATISGAIESEVIGSLGTAVTFLIAMTCLAGAAMEILCMIAEAVDESLAKEPQKSSR